MVKQSVFLALGLAFMTSMACSSKSSGGSGGSGATGSGNDSGSVDTYCEESCAKQHSCDKTIDEQTCSNSCSNNFAAVGPKLRSDFLGSITDCVTGEDCVTNLSGEAFVTCTDEAVAELAPSKVGTDFCTDYEAAVEKCNGDFDKAECYNQAKTFDDDALADASECLDKACADVDDCVKATLGDVTEAGGGDTDPGTGGTTGTGGTDPGTGGSNPGTGGTDPGGPSTGTCVSGAASECVGDDSINYCASATKMWTEETCEAFYGEIGFASSTCAAGKCDVGDALDPDCLIGANAYCLCSGGCTDAELLNAYIACYLDDPAGTQAQLHCLVDYVDANNAVDCDGGQACVNAQ